MCRLPTKKTHQAPTSPSNSQVSPPTPTTLRHNLPTLLYTSGISAALAMADRKKKDRYAGAAYEFGANSSGQAGVGVPSAAPGYGVPPAPAYGGAPAAPGYGAPSPAYGGPAPAYGAPAPAYGQPPAQDPNALNQQFGQMNMGPPQGQAVPQTQQPMAATQQNQLFPSDLIAQPFHVSELYNPPPPINLPSNAAATPSEFANESSKYLRCTMNTMPASHSLLKKSKIPLAIVISPYASLHDSEDQVPVVHDQIISRCRRCRAYSMYYAHILSTSPLT
jgi:protein transport protein SEC24